MFKKNPRLESIIDKYAKELARSITIDKIFLFGSAARGTMTKDSDVDLIVLSSDFIKMDFMKRLQLLSRASYSCAGEVAMDVIGYTPREFAEMDKIDSVELKKIKREGYFVR